jgi:GNAT superfamily N-acetyltransferase
MIDETNTNLNGRKRATNISDPLDDRMEYLRRQPLNASGVDLVIRPMMRSDIPDVMRLRALAGWSQSSEMLTLFLDIAPSGCFVMARGDRVVATITICNYGNLLAWIGMMLVDPEFRRMGIATRLMNHAMDALPACETFKLDATANGRLVYEKLGFADKYGVERLRVDALSPPTGVVANGISLLEQEDFDAVNDMDRTVFGVDRTAVLALFGNHFPYLAFKLVRDGRIAGYCMGREGSDCIQLGPLVADTIGDARELVTAVLQTLQGRSVIADIMDSHREFRQVLVELGFQKFRSYVRMVRGQDRFPGDLARQFIIAGPEFG